MKFQLEEVKRAALWKSSTKADFVQTGWGLSVRLAQRDQDYVHGKLEMMVSDPAQIKMFQDAEIGASFEITVTPVK
jgi:hypothetical protein